MRAFVGDAFVIEIIARIEGGIADEFEEAAVHLVGAGLGDDIGEAGGAVTDLRRHHSGTGLHFLNGVHVEIGKSRAAQLRIGGVEPVEGEDGGSAALSIHRELRGKVGGAVGVGHGAGRQQQQLAEVARVQRQAGNLSAGKTFAAAGLRGSHLRLKERRNSSRLRKICRFVVSAYPSLTVTWTDCVPDVSRGLHGNFVVACSSSPVNAKVPVAEVVACVIL